MQLPTNGSRVLLLVGFVSFGLLLAGSGVAVGGEGATGGPVADSTDLSVWAPAGSAAPLAQTDPPGQAVPPNNNSTGQDGEANGQTNTTTGPPGSGESDGAGESNPNAEKQGGSNGQQTGGPSAGPGNSSAGETGQESPGNSGNSGGSDGQQTGGPSAEPGNGSTGETGQERPGNSGTSGPPTDGETGASGSGEGVGSPGSPGVGSNNSDEGTTGPPGWIDAPTGPDSEGFEGPPGKAPGLANGTSRTVSVGGENVTVTVSQGPPSDTPGVRAWATVTNATPNKPVPVALPEPANNATVRTEQVSIAVQNRQNVSLSVATGDRPTNQTPEFTPTTAAEGMGYIDVAHTVPDAEIENVSFRFSVDGSKLDPDERDDVSLYRYHNGTWTELPTEYVDRNGSAFIFHAESPGLSAFTVGKKVASFQIQQATLLTEVQTTLDPVNVRVRITNEGGADGVFTAKLLLDDEHLDTEQLSIAAGGTRQTSFEESVEEPGRYTVLVNNYTVGTLNVSELGDQLSGENDAGTSVGSETFQTDQLTEDETRQTGVRMPGFGFLIAIIGGGIAMWSRRRTR